MNDISFSPYIAGVVSIDHENSVKVFSAAPSLLGKGHNMFNANGPTWVCHAAIDCLGVLITRRIEHRVLRLPSIRRNWLRRWVLCYDEHAATSTEGRRGKS